MTKKISIETTDNSPFYFGQKIYIVESVGSEYLQTPCPVCDGTRKINYKGFELDCPHCNSIKGKDETGILISDFVVREYIVNKFEVAGENVKSRYGKEITSEISVSWWAFTVALKDKRHRYSWIDDRSIKLHSSCVFDAEEGAKGWVENEPRIPSQQRFNVYKNIHLTKKTADKMCKEIIERQKELLDEFNNLNKTDIEYPF